MSAASRTKETAWYKEHYEKIAVVTVLVALLGSTLFLLIQIDQAKRALTDASWERVDVSVSQYQPIDLDVYAPFEEAMEHPPQIAARGGSFLVSDLRVMSVNPDVVTPIPYDAEVCPWTQYRQPEVGTRDTTGDGIPDEWYVSFGLDPFDVALSARDVDGDGFTVREEFEAGTSPVDAEDHPSHAYKLRVRRVAVRPFGLRFQGIQELAEGDVRFHLNVRGRDRSYFVRMGETVENYEVVGFREHRRDDPSTGRRVDASILTLRRPDGREVELTVNVDFNVQERVAEVVFVVDQQTFRVSAGDVIEVMGNQFNVVDIRRDSVVVLDVKRGETVEVQREEVRDEQRHLMGGGLSESPPGELSPELFR